MERNSKTEAAVKVLQKAARGLFAKVQQGSSSKRRKVLGSFDSSENAGMKSMAKKPAGERPISLYQSHFKCPSILIPLLSEGDEVLLTFDPSSEGEVGCMLQARNVALEKCYREECHLADGGNCVALVADVVQNNPLISNPWDLLQNDDAPAERRLPIYATDGGLVLRFRPLRSDESSIAGDGAAFIDGSLTFADVSGDALVVWTERQLGNFEHLRASLPSMEIDLKIKLLSSMLKEVDAVQQAWIGCEFYKTYNETRRRLSCDQSRKIKSLKGKLSKESQTHQANDEQEEDLHDDRMARYRKIDVSAGDIHTLYHRELVPSKIKAFSDSMNSDILEKRNKLVSCFSKFRDVLIDEGLLSKWWEQMQRDFPLTTAAHLVMILPHDHKGPPPAKKKHAAIWRFVSGARKRNKDMFHELSVVFSLSLMSASSSDKAVKTMNSLGIACSTSSAQRAITKIKNENKDPSRWLSEHKWLAMCFDNMVYNLPMKDQTSGKSVQSVDGTSKFSRQLDKYEAPETVGFVTNEGQPGVTYVDQPIPAPIGMLPYEKLDETTFAKLLSHPDGMTAALNPDTFQRDILGQQPEPSREFDVTKMEASNGERTRAYWKLLRRNDTYVKVWQFLSSTVTIESSSAALGDLEPTAKAHQVQTVINNAREKEFKNARAFHKETVRTWYPLLDEVALTFLHSVSVFSEKTTEGTAHVMIEMMIEAGLLVYNSSSGKITLAVDWEERLIFMCGDAYSVDNGYSFAAKTETSIGQYTDDWEKNMNISKALSRILWFPGDLHIEFHLCKSIYTIFYPGFIHAFQAASQVTRLVQDPTKCFQLAKTFLRYVYEQVYRGFALKWWSSLPDDCGIETVHDAVTAFEDYIDGLSNSKDGVFQYVARFLELCQAFFLFSDCVERQDAVGQEIVLNFFQPIFYFVDMKNYKEVTWREHEMLYSSERSVIERETLRRNRTLLLNEGKNAIGTDTFCELINGKVVAMKKAKTIEKCSERSASVTVITHADEFRRVYVCNEDIDATPKSSTNKRSGYVRERIMELCVLIKLFDETEGRLPKDINLYALLDDLKTKFPSKSGDDEDDDENDEITIAEKKAVDREAMIESLISNVIPNKKKKGKSSPNDENVDNGDSDDESNGSNAMDAEDTEDNDERVRNGLPKKILLSNGKIRIGTSHQDKMLLDPKGVAKVDPFAEGNKKIAKDNVKAKRERKKKEQERAVENASMCHDRSIRRQHELRNEGDIDLHPRADQHETIAKYKSDHSPWD